MTVKLVLRKGQIISDISKLIAYNKSPYLQFVA